MMAQNPIPGINILSYRTFSKLFFSSLVLILLFAYSGQHSEASGGGTLRLDGTGDYVLVPNDPALNPSGSITIEAWVYPDTTTSCGTIVGKSFSTGYWLGLCNNNKLRYYTSGSGTALDSNSTIPEDEWTHVAVTYNGATLRFYINGMLDRTVSVSNPLPLNSNALGIGADYNGGFEFDGNLAEVRIWSKARTLSEIRSDMIRMVAGERPDLVSAWPLRQNAEDVTGNYPGTLIGNAGFFGSEAPVYPDAPIQIPRLASTPTVNGQCGPGEYGALSLPIWYATTYSQFNIRWINLGATSSNIYACADGMRLSSHADHHLAMYFDPNNDGGALADNDDYRLRVDWPEDTASQHRGNGFGGYQSTTDLSFAGDGYSFEFDWGAEFRVGRSALPTSSSQFRLQFVQNNWLSSGADVGWPLSFNTASPNAWPVFQIDDFNIPTPDSRPPSVFMLRLPAGEIMDGDAVTLSTEARDDVSVSKIELFVDGAIVKTCNFSGTTPTAFCALTDTYGLGGHSFYAVATDWRGAVRFSDLSTFFVEVDGEAPEVHVRYLTEDPAFGTPVEIEATATDPSGIDEIEIIGYGSGSHTCTFSGANRRETCTHTFSITGGSQLGRYRARAADQEGLTNITPWQYILFNNTGSDFDDDGISDSLEARLCTNRFNADTDGDALSDKWEILGATFADGDYVPLPSLGADPCHKDVFFQMDYETGLQLPQSDRDNMVNLFRANDITLHITGKEHPAPANSNTCPPAENSPNGAAEAAAQLDSNGEYYFPPKYNWTHYYGMARYHDGRSGAWGHIFTLDACVNDDYVRTIHELGHSIGLGHGGRVSRSQVIDGDAVYYSGDWNNQNRKPNYNSVMNYRMWSRSNYCYNTITGDYSSTVDLSQRQAVSLDEEDLDERTTSLFNITLRARSCAAANSVPVTIYTCDDPDESNTRYIMLSDGTQTLARVRDGSEWQTRDLPGHTAGIDWDCDGNIESSVSSNINGDGGDNEFTGGTANDVLLGVARDWDYVPAGRNCHSFGTDRQSAAYIAAAGGTSCASRGATDFSAGAAVAPSETMPDLYAMSARKQGQLVIVYSGLQSEHVEQEALFGKPNENLFGGLDIERCDGKNNDGDLQVDEGCNDSDGDSVTDAIDNCPETANGTQADLDGDHLGDVCQTPSLATFGINDVALPAIFLEWSGTPADVGGYDLYRRVETDLTLEFIVRLPAGTTEYVDQLPGRGSDGYAYELRVLNLNMEETGELQTGFNLTPTSVGLSQVADSAETAPYPILITGLLLLLTLSVPILRRRS